MTRVVYFRPRVVVEVIFDVDIRSPIYFCRNLLLLSNLSCSSLTASIRWKIMRSDSCNALACLCNSSLASLPIISRSRLVLRGLIDLTSFGANRVSTGPESEESRESRGTMIVPLLFLLWNFGRAGTGALISLSSSDDPDEESDRVGGSDVMKVFSSPIARWGGATVVVFQVDGCNARVCTCRYYRA